MLSIDHSLPEKICLYDCEYSPRDSISLEKLRAQVSLYSEYAAYVNQFLDYGFVLEEARKYGIVRISFYDPDIRWMDPSWYDERGWKDGSLAKIKKLPDRKDQYEIFLNPFMDREAAARFISERNGIRVKPDEVNYFSWFHECGHTRKIAGELCPENLAGMFLRSCPDKTIQEFKSKAERIADAWAVKELKKWRRRRYRQARTILPARGLIHA